MRSNFHPRFNATDITKDCDDTLKKIFRKTLRERMSQREAFFLWNSQYWHMQEEFGND